MLAVAERSVTREASLAWLTVYFAERRAAQLVTLVDENRLLQQTLAARIANGKAMPADRTMAQQEALALDDRRDDLARDVARARAGLRRWVGERAGEPLAGEPPALAVPPELLRNDLHRHVELATFASQRGMAQAEVNEAQAELRGDWGWELVYSRRGPQFGDMLSFQFMFDLPWQRQQRQAPQLDAKLREIDRLDAEREDATRRHGEELEAQLAELQALDRQHTRLQQQGLPLAAERVALTLAAYQSGRSDLAPVLVARREVVEARMRLIELDAQRMALRVRLNTLVAE
jgi:outer membrane protein TolC